MSIINHRINASDVYIYPSANALDGGEINTEENLSALSDKFSFNSFVLKRKNQTSSGLVISANGTNVNITNGECFIDGRYIKLNYDNGSVNLDMSTLNDFDKSIFDYLNTKFYLLLILRKDTSGCVIGDLQYGDNLICDGIRYVLSDTLDIGYPYLLLGTVTATSASTIEVVDNPNKYYIIDISQLGTDDGSIEDWLISLLNSALNNLSTLVLNRDGSVANSPSVILNYNNTQGWVRNTSAGTEVYFTDANGNSASILITPTGLIYNNASTTNFDIIATLKALSGGISWATSGGTTNTPHGATYNGTTEVIARADHYHNGYIRNNTSSITTAQTISTPLTINNNVSITGNLTGSSGKNITGFSRVYNAVWNDYADAVLKANNTTTEPGDIIAKDEYSDGYVLATSYNAKLVVGVHSDTYGHLLGGDKDAALEENLNKYIPIALAGNVKVKVVGRVKIGDFIVASFIPGVGVASNGYVPGTIVGKALENKDTDDMSRILMQVMLI